MRTVLISFALAITFASFTFADAQQTTQRQQQREQQQQDRAQQRNDAMVQAAVEQLAAQVDELQLIYRKDVQKDLKLELGQRNKLDNFHDRQLAELRTARIQNRRNNGSLIEMEEKQRKETQEKIDELLTQAQKDRLKQISLQLRGESVVLMAEIQQKIGATPDQVSQFTNLQTVRDAKMADLRNQQPMRGQNVGDQVRQIQKDMNQGLAAALTEEQKKKLKELFGEPFKAA